MLFTEFRFLAFFAVVFVLYWSTRSNRLRKLLLLVASYLFYGAWSWKFLLLIIGSTIVDFFIGLRLGATDPNHPDHRRARRGWITASMVWNLGVLGLFKYYNFFIDSGQHFLTWLGLHPNDHTLRLILPVGISFFTFQSMSYSIDIYRGHLKPARSLLDFSTFIAFFPQLFAGPIVRAVDFLPQLGSPRRLALVPGRAMVMMFLVGYIKKACVADNIAPFVDEYFANPSQYNWVGCWSAVLLYAAQIYCDFSGYTDMAIAAAGLLGYEFCQNFNFPYLARNISDFWRRWHMSLSSWLRDYLYIPLGGNRGGKWKTHRNLFLTMVLGGLWHGAAWTFVIWGAMHGGALIAHKEFGLWNRRRADARLKRHPASPAHLGIGAEAGPTTAIPPEVGPRSERAAGAKANTPPAALGPFGAAAAGVAMLLTFYWVCVAWIFFRAPTLDIARQAATSFIFLRSGGSAGVGPKLLLAFLVLALIHWLAHRGVLRRWWAHIPAWQFAAVCGVIVATALPWTPLRYQPFIYFQF